MNNAAIIWTFSSLLAAACFAWGFKLYESSQLFGFTWYAGGFLILVVASIVWISLEKEILWQHRAVMGFLGAITGLLLMLAVVELFQATKAIGQTQPPLSQQETPMQNDQKDNHVVGATIIGNNQGGPAAEIISHGTLANPSIGADIAVTAAPGQSVTGMRVIQNGPGTGLRVIQNGPGIGLRITVGNGPNGQ